VGIQPTVAGFLTLEKSDDSCARTSTYTVTAEFQLQQTFQSIEKSRGACR
jgi:hypothetical protein